MIPNSTLDIFSASERCVERVKYGKSKNNRMCNILSSRDRSGKPAASPPLRRIKGARWEARTCSE